MAVYRVRSPFAFSLPSGQAIGMKTGDLVDENHPAYKHKGARIYMDLVDESEAVMSEPPSFGPPAPERTAEEVAAGAVETATAAPGEKRSVSNPRRSRSSE